MVADYQKDQPPKSVKLSPRKPTKYEKKLKSVRLFRKLLSLRYVKLLVEGELVKIDLKSEICLTPTSVSDRFYIEADQFVFFRRLLNEARSRLADAKDDYTRVYATVEIWLRGTAEKNGQFHDGFYFKHLTELQDEVVNALKEVRKAEKEVDLLEAIVAGLEIQKSMVIQAAAENRLHTRYLNREED